MLREAGKIMEQEAADFLFTGEVVGQRPMSQRRDALKSVEKLAGYPGRVLRPLSAKLLDPTLVEEQGLVDRDRLLDIHGRSRKRQEALARHYGIKEYPQPGGGCMLTKEGFAKRLRQLMRSYPHAGVREVETLKWGRLFLLPGGAICIVGRHQPDNTRLNELARDEDIVLHAVEHPGPTALLLASPKADEDLELAAMILLSYSDAPTGRISTVEWKHNGKAFRITYKKTARDRYQKYLI
jgi:tRNA U34 2-thiouridine synthase MnmA/TrmU